MKIKINERSSGDIIILDLFGNLDFSTAPLLKVKLDSLIRLGHHKFVLNFHGVDLIDSTGVGSLMYGLKMLDTTEGDIKIVGLTTQNLNVFSVLELDKVFSIMKSENQALTSFLEDDATVH